MHPVVGTLSNCAFAFLHISKQPKAAVGVRHHDVLPFRRVSEISISAILTDNGRGFCGTEQHPYEFYLDLDVKHGRTPVQSLQTGDFTERFHLYGSGRNSLFPLEEDQTQTWRIYREN